MAWRMLGRSETFFETGPAARPIHANTLSIRLLGVLTPYAADFDEAAGTFREAEPVFIVADNQ